MSSEDARGAVGGPKSHAGVGGPKSPRWTADEDQRLSELVRAAPDRARPGMWDRIALSFPDRTASAVEHHWKDRNKKAQRHAMAAPAPPSKTLEKSQKIRCLQDNPKQKGTACRDRYEKYKSATTVKEFYEKEGTPADLDHDIGKGFIEVIQPTPAPSIAGEPDRKKRPREGPAAPRWSPDEEARLLSCGLGSGLDMKVDHEAWARSLFASNHRVLGHTACGVRAPRSGVVAPGTDAAKLLYHPCRTGVFAPVGWRSSDTGRSALPPAAALQLEWVHGYAGVSNLGNNLWCASSGEAVYCTAAVGVVCDVAAHAQRFFLGHDDDVKCIAVDPKKELAGETHTT